MTRTFVTVSHTVPPDGSWALDDLAGSAGRVDVLCRNAQAALFLSHGIRQDTDCIFVFTADPDRPTAVRIQGASIRHLNPDERSTAARIKQALVLRGDDAWWETVQPGLQVAPFGLAEVLADLPSAAVLDAEGRPLLADGLPPPTLVLSDHQPFTVEDEQCLAGLPRLSLGRTWYHGNQAIAVVQHAIDSQ